MLCRDARPTPIERREWCKALCFPHQDSLCCSSRILELSRVGVDGLYSFGETIIAEGLRAIGKGHAAVVILAHHVDHGLVALKIRRTDSKRLSMEWEAQVLSRVVDTGFAPRLYSFSRNFLVRDYIDGCTLGKLAHLYGFEKRHLLEALKSLLRAALAIDLAGVDLEEVSRPLNQVVYLCCDTSKPFFIDFESAKMSSRPLNVTKIISFITSGSIGSASVRSIVGLDSSAIQRLTSLAKEYKLSSGDSEKKRSIANRVLEVFEKL